MRNLGILFLSLFTSSFVWAQEKSEGDAEKRSRILIAIGHMNVSQGVDVNGNKSWLSVPVWMIDYDYSLNRKWFIGIHNDISTESYKVDGFFFEKNSQPIERVKPVASVAAVSFKPGKHAVYSFGTGAELSSDGNYFLTQLGFEYGIELPGDWELCPSISYDLKWSAYDSFSISLGVGKKF